MTSPRLIVIAGPSRGQVISLAEATTFGRDGSSTIQIADPALSRRHCSIEIAAGACVLRDLDSRNGTIVNGAPIRNHRLVDGDEIRIGVSALLFSAADPAPVMSGGSTVPAPLILDGLTSSWRFTSEVTVSHDLIGESGPMREVYRRLSRAAPADSTVLIHGETGTGKELIARAIHANSPRASAPFVAINCAAVPDGLMESELFGHERGAFTGALSQKRGRLETASGGTVFLDEIGELPAALQSKLLRVLQERTLDRVGGTRPIPIDVRIVAATNRDLAGAVKSGTFRQDLYYRLNVVSIAVPALRDRAEDVLLLITFFVHKHAGRSRRRVRGVTREARAALTQYSWPGNVRELENAIERAIVMGDGDWIELADLPEHLLESVGDQVGEDGYHARVNKAKRDTIARALERSGGNVAQAARELRLQPTYLHRLVRNLGLREPE
jgi:transcriptional regulator with PAS, ATPase and Fis domain